MWNYTKSQLFSRQSDIQSILTDSTKVSLINEYNLYLTVFRTTKTSYQKEPFYLNFLYTKQSSIENWDNLEAQGLNSTKSKLLSTELKNQRLLQNTLHYHSTSKRKVRKKIQDKSCYRSPNLQILWTRVLLCRNKSKDQKRRTRKKRYVLF